MLSDLTINFTPADLAALSPEEREFVFRQHLLRAPISQPERSHAGGERDPWKVVESQSPEALREQILSQSAGSMIHMDGPAGPRW